MNVRLLAIALAGLTFLSAIGLLFSKDRLDTRTTLSEPSRKLASLPQRKASPGQPQAATSEAPPPQAFSVSPADVEAAGTAAQLLRSRNIIARNAHHSLLLKRLSRLSLVEDGKTYFFLDKLFAIANNPPVPPETKPLFIESGFAFVESSGLPIVYDPINQRIAVVSGAIRVELQPGTSIDGVAKDLHLDIQQSFEHLNTHFLTPRATGVLELKEAVQGLSAHQAVKRAALDLVFTRMEAK